MYQKFFVNFFHHNSVTGLRTLKPKNLENLKNLKVFYKNLGFFSSSAADILQLAF